MNYITNLNVFRWRKNHYSEFYISTLISFFVFSLAKDYVITFAQWMLSGIQAIFQYTPEVGQQWYVLVLVCFLITCGIQNFIIQPLQFGTSLDAQSAWENFWTGVIIFGFFLFVTNFVFIEIPLPDYPVWIQRLLKPSGATVSGEAERNFWSIVPWVWVFLPIFIFYYSILNNKSGGSSE